ncbi:Mu transposase C-terminal domain-containing protein [Bradyrhizobium sp. GCM10028915]|uniref:Mu transposase C-terminal domain-containing protein n=1 Tax=Bradyrhizobium sp. GCM10028915 TaxID=3273385 RepID=UPI003618F03B
MTIERRLRCDGIEVHGIRYQSPILQRLREQFGSASVRVQPDPEDVRYVSVWHPSRSVWIKVPLAEFERLATQGEIDELAFGLYRRKR